MAAATIYSVAISPSNEWLVCTSDTNTLHVFELAKDPAQKNLEPPQSSDHSSNRGDASASRRFSGMKWGSLANLPFAPRIFKDEYSLASTAFDPGTEPEAPVHPASTGIPEEKMVPFATPRKGRVGWIDNETIIVISAGLDARYERFIIGRTRDGKLVCVRDGWSRFMRPN